MAEGVAYSWPHDGGGCTDMRRGEQEYAPDYDAWLLSEPDDGEWGVCWTCGEMWDEDGPRCDCEDDGTFLGDVNVN